MIDIDTLTRLVDVQGMTTDEHRVDAVLPFGLMPLVVPELKDHHRRRRRQRPRHRKLFVAQQRMPHEAVVEIDVMTGDGDVVTARRTTRTVTCSTVSPSSDGTLGSTIALRLQLEDVQPYVHTCATCASSTLGLWSRRSVRCASVGAEHGGERVDFIDGVVFSPTEAYLTLAGWTAVLDTSDYTRTQIYYRSIQRRREDWLTVRDYLWRWDTDWWCRGPSWPSTGGSAAGRPGHLRSDVYWRIKALRIATT